MQLEIQILKTAKNISSDFLKIFKHKLQIIIKVAENIVKYNIFPPRNLNERLCRIDPHVVWFMYFAAVNN